MQMLYFGGGANQTKSEYFFGWDNKMLESKVNEKGRWEVKVKTPSAGYTPYTVSICSAQDSILLSDILIGDVWFVGGQSNMQMNFHGNPDQPVQDAQKILLRCKHKGIRLFRVNNGYAISASDTLTIDGKWTSASPDNVKEFSVVGYIFGENYMSWLIYLLDWYNLHMEDRLRKLGWTTRHWKGLVDLI